MPLDGPLLATLRALLDRLIPRDDFPGAIDAGVERYITRQLQGDVAPEQEFIVGGVAALERETIAQHQCGFTALPEGQQDALLEAVSRGSVQTSWPCPPGAWFHRMVELAAEGFYADPGQGGNRGEVSWNMIGYQRRVPARPTAP